jgi:hypothetical protein
LKIKWDRSAVMQTRQGFTRQEVEIGRIDMQVAGDMAREQTG